MIDRQFWEDVKSVWIVQIPPKVKDAETGSDSAINPDLLKESWNAEEIPFDLVDYNEAVQAVFNGGDIPLKQCVNIQRPPETEKLEPDKSEPVKPEPEKPKRPQLDTEMFDSLLEKQTLPDYVEACKLLIKCELPDKMEGLYDLLIERMPVLQDAIVKFEGVYQPDMYQFYEYYIPEALQLTETYLEYLDAGISEQIIQETEKEVMDAVNKLLTAVNDIIDEIYRFASMEIKAKAKALESLMSQDGYIDTNFKIN